jgi:chromosome segregation ATPase
LQLDEAEVQPFLNPRITLEILRGRASQKSRVMTAPTLLIGSDVRCDVQMRSPSVAAKHCLITRENGVVRATRLSADHPLLLNGKPAAGGALTDGDTLAIGPFELRVRFSEASNESSTPSNSSAPPTVSRPRFALLDRRNMTKPQDPDPTNPNAPEHVEQGRAAELQEKDARLQEWANRLQAQEAEIARAREEAAAVLDDCRRQRQTLEERRRKLIALRARHRTDRQAMQSRFASLLGEWGKREGELKCRQSNVEEREERCRLLAKAIDAREAGVDSREKKAAAALDLVEHRRAALEHERTLLDKEWQRLFARQQEVADKQASVDRAAERIASEQVLIADARRRVDCAAARVQSLAEDAASRAAEADAQAVRLRGRQRQVEAQARTVVVVGEKLREKESELSAEAERLERQAVEMHQRWSDQRQAIEDGRAVLDADLRSHEDDKRSFEARRAAWNAEVASLSKAKEELDRRASLLAARERALTEPNGQTLSPAELERRTLALRKEQERLAAECAEAIARRRALDAETGRLGELAKDLQVRQQALLDRERRFTEAAATEQENLDRAAERLQAEQKALDARAAEQRRGWERLKESAVRFGSRRKVMLERLAELETQFERSKREIAAIVESRRKLRASLDGFAEQSKQRERQAMEWLRGARADSDAAADAHRRFTKQFDASVPFAPTSLRVSLGDWSNRMKRLQGRLSNGESALKGPTMELPTDGDEPDVVEYPSTVAGEGAVRRREGAWRNESNFADKPAPHPARSEPPSPATGEGKTVVLPPPPPRWLFKLVDLGLADDEVLTYLLVQARERNVAVEDLLVEGNVVTRYQLDCVSQDRYDGLTIGPARILDLLHEGSIATTYRVSLAPFEKPVALRLLHRRVLKSDAVKSAFLEHASSARRFRHPSAAGMLAPFAHEDQVGVATEFAAGRPLPTAAEEMTPSEVVDCFRQCLSALFAGQRAGFVHRSLKPSRIMVAPMDRIVLLGFGEPEWLIRLHRCEKGPADDYYVAPEDRSGGNQIDARADMFSLCRIFLEVVLGRRPAHGEAIQEPDGYSARFIELLLRGMDANPAVRCGSFADILRVLEDHSAGWDRGPVRSAA